MRQVFRVLRKEIVEATRDRNLMVHLVLVPLFLYPLLGLGAWQIFLLIQGSNERTPPLVLLDRGLPPEIADSLAARPDLRVEDLEAGRNLPLDAAGFRRLRRQWPDGPVELLLAWQIAGQRFALFHDSSRESSQRARDIVAPVVRRHLERVQEERGRRLGMTDADLHPFGIESVDTASPRQISRYVLAMLLPLLLMVMLPQGAYYATLDTVVGERERGTLETLITSPLRRGEIVLGKFLYVSLSSLVGFLLNLLSLTLFLSFVLQLMGLETSWTVRLSFLDLAVVVVAALLTSAFLSAAMMVAAVRSRNYREGQAALMPLYLVTALAGLVVVSQGDTLDAALAWIPVVNIAALLRETLQGSLDLHFAATSLVSLGGATALMLAVAARIARREEILFDPKVGWRRLVSWKRERTTE